jgi:molybdenum cofactor cytidylyltransferase
MKFGPIPIADAVGCVAAHTVRAGDVIVRKGAAISESDAQRLAAAGLSEIVAVRLEAGDLDENAAAEQLARALAGRAVVTEAPFTGRVNLFAAAAGILQIDAAIIDALNTVDEAITVATLPALKPVVAGEMVGTVKIIPYAVPDKRIAEALERLGADKPIAVAEYKLKSVAVISTLLPGLKPSVVDKTLRTLAERLQPAAAGIERDARVPHESPPLAEAIREAAAGPAELVVVFGASAITDRRDVVPQALVDAGGTVEHLGMPVDPGNLLMIGTLGGKPVIGAPGCARSPKENGFDWVLQRMLANIPVKRADIQGMGVGGLLMEIVSRPQPRAPGHGAAPVAGIVLAAGRSTRMGTGNKLLQEVRGVALVRHAVEAQLASRAAPVFVVTGHQQEEVRAALAGLEVRFVHNPDFADGLASSLKAGIAALPEDVPGVVVCLGDMPNVTAGVIDRLAQAFADRPEALAVAPTLLGQRGNPVLLARALFAQVETLSGDHGARRLIDAAGEAVEEVALDDPAIALDIDTPEALKALTGQGPRG